MGLWHQCKTLTSMVRAKRMQVQCDVIAETFSDIAHSAASATQHAHPSPCNIYLSSIHAACTCAVDGHQAVAATALHVELVAAHMAVLHAHADHLHGRMGACNSVF